MLMNRTASSLLSPGPLLLAALIVLAALSRVLPHPPNFSPVAAVALFGGAYFAARHWAFVVPLAACSTLRRGAGLRSTAALYAELVLQRRLLAGVRLHRAVHRARLRPARTRQRRARAGLLAGRLGAVLRWSPTSAPGWATRCTRRPPPAWRQPTSPACRSSSGRCCRHPVLLGPAVRRLRAAATPACRRCARRRPDRDRDSVGKQSSGVARIRSLRISTRPTPHPWATASPRSTPAPATTAPPAWATARRVGKDSARVTAYGTVDEANSAHRPGAGRAACPTTSARC